MVSFRYLEFFTVVISCHVHTTTILKEEAQIIRTCFVLVSFAPI